MEWTWAWLVFLAALIAIPLTPVITLSGKSPAATLAWLFCVWAMPGLGPLLYVLVGRGRLHRGLARKRRRALTRVREPLDHSVRSSQVLSHGTLPLPKRFRQLARMASRMSETRLTSGNRVELLSSAPATYDRMLADIAGAERQVHLEYYIWREDSTGRRFIDAVVERAHAGVEVRLLLDAVGAYQVTSATIERVRAAGGRVAFFHPVNPLKRRFNLNFRNHRKLAVIDGRIAYTGGINVGNEYLGRDGDLGPWRDMAVRVDGPAVRWLQRTFAEDWFFVTGELLSRERDFPARPESAGRAQVQVVQSGPDEDLGNLHRIFFSAITMARRSVWITTPYFIPDDSVQLALETAVLGGVDVRIVVPGRSDSFLVDAAARWYLASLIMAGARVFRYERGYVHAKTMVVDGIFSSVGSANMDIRSFRLNFEAGVLIYDTDFARELIARFEEDIAHSREVTRAELRQRGTIARTLEALARLASPLL
ncbi:cardiolipin synthase [Planctomycetota bacterium]